MGRRWIVNASPLILLGKADHQMLLAELADELIVPAGVFEEVSTRADGLQCLESLTALSTVRVQQCDTIPRQVEVWDLGRGESEVLALACASPGSRVVVDDREARRCAQAIGVASIGTLGVVMRAKQQHVIPEALPVLEHLRRCGLYLTDDLVDQALAHLGEARLPSTPNGRS